MRRRGCGLDPVEDEVIKTPFHRDLGKVVAEDGETDFLNGEYVAGCGDDADPAWSAICCRGWLHGGLGFAAGFFAAGVAGAAVGPVAGGGVWASPAVPRSNRSAAAATVERRSIVPRRV